MYGCKESDVLCASPPGRSSWADQGGRSCQAQDEDPTGLSGSAGKILWDRPEQYLHCELGRTWGFCWRHRWVARIPARSSDWFGASEAADSAVSSFNCHGPEAKRHRSPRQGSWKVPHDFSRQSRHGQDFPRKNHCPVAASNWHHQIGSIGRGAARQVGRGIRWTNRTQNAKGHRPSKTGSSVYRWGIQTESG